MTGAVVAGSVGLVMVTLACPLVRLLPSFVHEMEVRFILKSEMETDKVRVCPATTSGIAVEPLGSPTEGETTSVSTKNSLML